MNYLILPGHNCYIFALPNNNKNDRSLQLGALQITAEMYKHTSGNKQDRKGKLRQRTGWTGLQPWIKYSQNRQDPKMIIKIKSKTKKLLIAIKILNIIKHNLIGKQYENYNNYNLIKYNIYA